MSHYVKEVIPHSEFYIAKFTKKQNPMYLIFIHGGPGFNCGTVEYYIEHEKLFESLDYNIVLYDQRGCGRSKNINENIYHADNVNDLEDIRQYLTLFQKMEIAGFIGHSYGAKLLYDFYKKFKCNIPGIFVSTAKSILIPRLNNLMLDLAYLKKTNPIRYQTILPQLNNLNLEKIWDLTEELAPIFQENKDRHYFYWANLDSFERTQEIQHQINLPTSNQVFMNVRKDLYSIESNFTVDIDTLDVPYLWINGFHDYIIDGSKDVFSDSTIITFYKSSHYPHIEENNLFSITINDFLQESKGIVCKKK